MPRVFLADAKSEARAFLRQLFIEMKMEVVGEAADWPSTLAQAPFSGIEKLVVDWDLLPSSPRAALEELRKACPGLVIVLTSHRDARDQAALSAGADVFISKEEMPEHVIERFRTVSASISVL